MCFIETRHAALLNQARSSGVRGVWVARPPGADRLFLSLRVGRATKAGSLGGTAYLNLQKAYSNAAVGRIKSPIQKQHRHHLPPAEEIQRNGKPSIFL